MCRAVFQLSNDDRLNAVYLKADATRATFSIRTENGNRLQNALNVMSPDMTCRIQE